MSNGLGPGFLLFVGTVAITGACGGRADSDAGDGATGSAGLGGVGDTSADEQGTVGGWGGAGGSGGDDQPTNAGSAGTRATAGDDAGGTSGQGGENATGSAQRVDPDEATALVSAWAFDDQPGLNPSVVFDVVELEVPGLWETLQVQLFFAEYLSSSSGQQFNEEMFVYHDGELHAFGEALGGHGLMSAVLRARRCTTPTPGVLAFTAHTSAGSPSKRVNCTSSTTSTFPGAICSLPWSMARSTLKRAPSSSSTTGRASCSASSPRTATN